MKPTYPTPLAVRFANLSMLIKQQVALAGKQHPNQSIASIVAGDVRVERLQSSSDKLQLWASIVRRPMKESLVGDVLESLEVSGSSLCDELHGIFSGIASHVINDGPCGWDQYLKKLGDLIPKIHQEYADFQREEVPRPSRQRLVLCFDGGGVASFSSLLILRALMCRITKIIEESAAQDDVLSLMGTNQPRNFFDYIFGSSSGGMIAIMLGRLQMTVEECIESFKAYSNDVFTHARLFHTLQFPFSFLDRPKYGDKSVRKAIENVVQKYEPDSEEKMLRSFAASHDQCRTVVLAIASNGNSSRLHLFRSYDHIGPATFLRFPGGPDSAPIWEVARATVAVPYYFKPATILDEKYRDAGAVFNNPSLEAFAEINAIHRPRQNNTEMPKEHKIVALEEATQRQRNKQSQNKAQKHGDPSNAIAVFVSIGSGKRPLPCLRFSKSIPGLKTLGSIHEDEAWAARTYTERTHEEMEKTARDTNTAYYRFNIGEGIGDMRFDKWKTKTLGGKHVNETLDVIERETSRYLREPETERSIQLCAEKVVRFRRGQL